jgi:hypothetical protein
VIGNALLGALIFTGQELAGHRDLARSPFGLGLRSNSMLKPIADMMPSPNSFLISAFQAGPSTITIL